MHPSIVVVIPVRYASSRFPGKALIDIAGLSLLQRTYNQVQLSPVVDYCIIATDDKRIYDHAISFGANSVMTSPDCLTGTDRVAEAIQKRPELQENTIIVNVQGDEPCLDPNIIDTVASALSPSANMVTAVIPIQNEEELENPNVVKCVRAIDGKALYFSRLPIPRPQKKSHTIYYRHIGIYAFWPEFLMNFADLSPGPLQLTEDLEMLKALEHGYTIVTVEASRYTPDVNSPEDISKVIAWNQSFYS